MKFKREMAVEMPIAFRKEALTLLMLIGITAAHVYAAQSEGNEQEAAPRTLEVLDVGYKLPIEIVAVRNLRKKEHWFRDLEVEIKNVSTEPIYGVYFLLLLPDDKGPSGLPVGFYVEYGRSEMLNPREHASAGDKPIGPGEVVILRADKRVSRGYEQRLTKENVPEQASFNVRMIFRAINFGDGSGFINGGVPYPGDPQSVSRPQRYVRIPADSK
jgi:hypothetical protein